MIDRHLNPGKEHTVSVDVPASHQEAAERIRAHLVSLRGGAPFLSPTDTALLVRWLDQRVPVSRILHGVERAAARRRAERRRVPLSLTHARLDAAPPPRAPCLAADPSAHLLDGLISTCHALALHPRDLTAPPHLLRELAEQLRALPTDDPEHTADLAISAIARMFDRAWNDLGVDGRQRYLERAIAELGDVAELVGPDHLPALAEEHARGLLRDDHPGLNASSVLQQVLP